MKITIDQFKASLTNDTPPTEWDQMQKSLWYDKKGDWDAAHSIAQDIPTKIGSAIHAYLHRKEGVIWNADYWYNRAGRLRPSCSLDEEWLSLAQECNLIMLH
jgi:hypothetical protein